MSNLMAMHPNSQHLQPYIIPQFINPPRFDPSKPLFSLNHAAGNSIMNDSQIRDMKKNLCKYYRKSNDYEEKYNDLITRLSINDNEFGDGSTKKRKYKNFLNDDDLLNKAGNQPIIKKLSASSSPNLDLTPSPNSLLLANVLRANLGSPKSSLLADNNDPVLSSDQKTNNNNNKKKIAKHKHKRKKHKRKHKRTKNNSSLKKKSKSVIPDYFINVLQYWDNSLNNKTLKIVLNLDEFKQFWDQLSANNEYPIMNYIIVGTNEPEVSQDKISKYNSIENLNDKIIQIQKKYDYFMFIDGMFLFFQ